MITILNEDTMTIKTMDCDISSIADEDMFNAIISWSKTKSKNREYDIDIDFCTYEECINLKLGDCSERYGYNKDVI